MALIAHYRLDGNADDAFGKFNGVANNVAWAAGKLGQAASFDGATSYVGLSPAPVVGDRDFSLAFWANPFSTATGCFYCTRTVLGEGLSLFWLSGQLRFDLGSQWTPGVALPLNAWSHVVVGAKSGTKFIYVNGVSKGSSYFGSATSVNPNLASVGASQIGGTGYGNFFPGLLDDVRIYDHALSVREIRDLAMGLALHYPMHQNTQYYENLLRPANDGVNTYHPSYRPHSGVAHGSGAVSTDVPPPVPGVTVYKIADDAADGQNARCGIRLNATDLDLYDEDCVLSYWVYLPSQFAARYTGWEVIVHQNTTGSDWHNSRGYNSTYNFYAAGSIRDAILEALDVGKVDQWQRISIRFKALTANINLPECDGNDNNVWVAGYTRVYVSGATNGGTPYHLYVAGGHLYKSREAQDWTYDVNQPVLSDASKQGNNSTLPANCPNWIPESPTGRGSYLFTNDATKRIDLPLVDLGSTLTYSCWAKQDSTEGHFYKFIVSSGRDFGSTPNGVNVLSHTGVIRVLYGGGPQGNGSLSSGVSVVGVWRHIVFTHDMVNGARLYVDGVLTATGPARTIDYSQANNRTVIGKMAFGYTSTTTHFPFSGPISDVRLYASALTADQVKELYQQRASLDAQGNFYAQLINERGVTKFQVTKAGQLSSQVSEVGITNGLIAYYPLNKDAQDYSGNGLHGVVSGATAVGGGFDGKGAHLFAGGNNIVANNVTLGSATSFCMWACMDNATPSQMLFSTDRPGGAGCDLLFTGGAIAWNTGDSLSNPIKNSGVNVAYPSTGVWHHFAVINDPVSLVLSLYVDGVLYGTAAHRDTTQANRRFIVGNYNANTSYAWAGKIANCKIFNRALTAQEIAVEYKRTGPTKMTQHQGVTYIQGEFKEV